LKKQAKALLRDFHEGKTDAVEKFAALRLNVAPKLSDAQHLIARDYGFAGRILATHLRCHVELLESGLRPPGETVGPADPMAVLGRLL